MDKKLDAVGRAANSADRRLIMAKDDVNEINFKVGEIKEGHSALRADHRSLLEKYDILLEQKVAEAERRADLSDEVKNIQRVFKNLQDGQTALVTRMEQIFESLSFLQTENEILRQENKKLRDNANNSIPQRDLSNTLLGLVQKFDARESRIDQIFNMMSVQPLFLTNLRYGDILKILSSSGVHQHNLLPTSPDSAVNIQYHPMNAMMHVPVGPQGYPAVAPTAPANAASMFNQHPAAAPTWYRHANATYQG